MAEKQSLTTVLKEKGAGLWCQKIETFCVCLMLRMFNGGLKYFFVSFPENQSKTTFKPRIFLFLLQFFFLSFFVSFFFYFFSPSLFLWGVGGGVQIFKTPKIILLLCCLFSFFLLKLLLYWNVSFPDLKS